MSTFNEAAEREAFEEWWANQDFADDDTYVGRMQLVWIAAKKEAAEQGLSPIQKLEQEAKWIEHLRSKGYTIQGAVTLDAAPDFDPLLWTERWDTIREQIDEANPDAAGWRQQEGVLLTTNEFKVLFGLAKKAAVQPTPAPYNEEAEMKAANAKHRERYGWDIDNDAEEQAYAQGWHDRASLDSKYKQP